MQARRLSLISWQPPLIAVILLMSFVSCTPSATSSSSTKAGATPVPALTYVAIGASDAFGIGTQDPDRESWPTVLAGLLGPHVHLINLGIPGEVVSEALTMELPVALAAKPNIITVWLAVNDLADGIMLVNYSQQLRALLTALRQGTDAQVFVGNIPDLTLVPHFFDYDPVALRAQVQRWNAVIAAICIETGVTLVDIYSAWRTIANNPDYISNDGFHLSAAGARQLAQFFKDTITAEKAA